ncbi:ribonuclease 3-like isoform X2 [Varroa destructor]|uniref:Ribonuclease 3 n=1 Tax=Varroa destructor TaxID=109461 RepID=A0A7M7KS10_VARDE|nr:ribonuclease 3-like isoform X2 [Varroa destructor]
MYKQNSDGGLVDAAVVDAAISVSSQHPHTATSRWLAGVQQHHQQQHYNHQQQQQHSQQQQQPQQHPRQHQQQPCLLEQMAASGSHQPPQAHTLPATLLGPPGLLAAGVAGGISGMAAAAAAAQLGVGQMSTMSSVHHHLGHLGVGGAGIVGMGGMGAAVGGGMGMPLVHVSPDVAVQAGLNAAVVNNQFNAAAAAAGHHHPATMAVNQATMAAAGGCMGAAAMGAAAAGVMYPQMMNDMMMQNGVVGKHLPGLAAAANVNLQLNLQHSMQQRMQHLQPQNHQQQQVQQQQHSNGASTVAAVAAAAAGVTDGHIPTSSALAGLWTPAPSASPVISTVGSLPLISPVPVTSPSSLLQVVPGTPVPRDNELARFDDARLRYDGNAVASKVDCTVSGPLQNNNHHPNSRLYRISSTDYNNYADINLKMSPSGRGSRWSNRSRSPLKRPLKIERSRSPSCRAERHRSSSHRVNNKSPPRSHHDSRSRRPLSRSASYRKLNSRETNGTTPNERNSSHYRHQPPLPPRTGSRQHRDHRSIKSDRARDREKEKEEKEFRFSSDNYSSDEGEVGTKEISEEDYRMEIASYTRCCPAELYFTKDNNNELRKEETRSTERFEKLLTEFEEELLKRAERTRSTQAPYERPKRKPHICMHYKKKQKRQNRQENGTKTGIILSSDSSSDSSDTEWCSSEEEDNVTELELKKKHPYRLHEELWFNDPGEMNDGPLCRCSVKAKRTGIRHNLFPGEAPPSPACDPSSNNAGRLFHYRVAITPRTNFALKRFPTVIRHDNHDFIFEGFSLFSHYKLPDNLPSCRIIRYNIEYLIAYIPEEFPSNFTVRGLDLLSDYLFKELLELVDINWRLNDQPSNEGCPQFHVMPRFVRPLPEKGKELLSLNLIIGHLLKNNRPLVSREGIPKLAKLDAAAWIDMVEAKVKGQLVTRPGMKPCSLRVDQLDREPSLENSTQFPVIVHFGMRPAQLSYAGNPKYQKALKELTKLKKYLATKAKVDYQDKARLAKKEKALQDLKQAQELKRDVTVVLSSEGFYRTGLRSDVAQHALVVPVLIGHLRFHRSLYRLEENLKLKFNDRLLLQLALTHPSYRENFGTNPDHARNSMTNCGMRQPEYGDRRVLYLYSRKRGIKMLLSIMSRLAKDIETASTVHHYERLEFLGDAVIEFLSSIHLFHMFPDVEEGGLATYRAAIVQNQHLAVLAKKLQLDEFMLYAHGSDLCHDLELKHAMANSLEALMGAIFLDHGIEHVDRVFGETLFRPSAVTTANCATVTSGHRAMNWGLECAELLERWCNYRRHPLQLQEPDGDRRWIEHYPVLQKLTNFEKQIGVEFTHIRLLARAFTHRSVGFNNLTLGSNQRLEFLGDTVLQLVSSEYLYKFFPEHHEGHLSLLRSSIVNNRTQAVVHDDLGMLEYSMYPLSQNGLKVKDRADILEAFLGALFVDKGLDYCRRFCQVVFFPRLEHFIRNQDWNDPKSKLQQCCLTLRHMSNGQPEIPLYKVIDSSGPTNTRRYTVAVYFRGRRMATASGHSIKEAQWQAASLALANYKEFFNHKVVEDIIKGPSGRQESYERSKEDRVTTAAISATSTSLQGIITTATVATDSGNTASNGGSGGGSRGEGRKCREDWVNGNSHKRLSFEKDNRQNGHRSDYERDRRDQRPASHRLFRDSSVRDSRDSRDYSRESREPRETKDARDERGRGDAGFRDSFGRDRDRSRWQR